MQKAKVCIALASLVAIPIAANLAQATDIPVAPLSVLRNQVPAPIRPQQPENKQTVQATSDTTKTLPVSESLNRSKLIMQAGTNEIVSIAQNHLNRIVTPFEVPKVTTTSDVTTELRDNVLYIGTDTDSPVTIFITEDGSEEVALSLTLIPKRIPPREISLGLAKQAGEKIVRTKRAKRWEESQPYIRTTESLFRHVALGKVPPGYQLSSNFSGHLPRCQQAGIEFNFNTGQIITGHNLRVFIGTATNSTDYALEFAEENCGDWNVAAVSAFPRNVLNAGEQTEVYVATRRNYTEEIKVDRPSLLGGQQ